MLEVVRARRHFRCVMHAANTDPRDAAALKRVIASVRSRGSVPTYLENRVVEVLSGAPRRPGDDLLVGRYLAALDREPQRFFTWEERQAFLAPYQRDSVPGTELDFRNMVCSQGALEAFSWRGLPCFKSHYDMSLYALFLQEVRPKSILELGSGAGGSAAYFADTARGLGLDVHIRSIDKTPVHSTIDGVSFIHADCIEWLENMALRHEGIPRPLLIIEDFHAPLTRFMHSLEGLMRPGDYLIVEDAIGKQDELGRALRDRPYAIDARYTDFFGVNCTSAMNGFLKKVDAR